MFKLMRPVLLGRLKPRMSRHRGKIYRRQTERVKLGIIQASTGRAGTILTKRQYLVRL